MFAYERDDDGVIALVGDWRVRRSSSATTQMGWFSHAAARAVTLGRVRRRREQRPLSPGIANTVRRERLILVRRAA
jgi:hypothetical protein